MSQHERWVFINGKLVPESAATLSLFDVGRMYGATFDESIRTFRQRFFKLEEHLCVWTPRWPMPASPAS